MSVCEKTKCTGCFACYNICPKKCIKMKENEYGYVYPEIDEKECIKCNMCVRTCPQNEKVELKKPLKAYAMQIKDRELLSKSASGGAASMFYYHIIKHNGIGYGVEKITDENAKFIRVDSINEIDRLKGSKYVHAYINNMFTEVRKDLEKNIKIIFIGTPCQVAGLRRFLKKDYDNLILVDLVCHGVPPQRLLREEIEEYKKYDINNIKFREGNKYILQLNCDNTKINKKSDESLYLDSFINGITLRDNCYQCIYANINRCSDITIGDFWGLSNKSKLYENKEQGVSLLLAITPKGEKLIKECEKYMQIEEREIEEAYNGNTQLRYPTRKTKQREKFKKMYKKYGYEKAIKKAMCKIRMKRKIKENKVIYQIYKKIKRKE